MHLPRVANKLALLGAFLLCLSLGFGLALVLKERLGSTAEADPCFGHGQLVEKSQRAVTQAEIDDMRRAGSTQMTDVQPGLTDFRKCRSGPGFVFVIDGTGHIWDSTQPSPDQLKSYYATHPAEDPRNIMATAEAERRKTDFVTPALPSPASVNGTILSGCDATWTNSDFQQINLKLCYLSDWRISFSGPTYVTVGNSTISMSFDPKAEREVALGCDEPVVFSTPAGGARLCTYLPNMVEDGQGHEMALPNGHSVRFFIKDNIEPNRLLAIRVALAAEELP